MNQEAANNPLLLLHQIELRSRQNAQGLPQQEEVKEEWSGIGFRVGDQSLVAPMGHVTEILHFPMLSRVPGAKDWVMGIANVRGNLLPVMDLAGFLDGNETRLNKRSRVLVINHKGVQAGLLVDGVLGMRHFLVENKTKELPSTSSVSIKPYLEEAFRSDDEHWAVFNMHKLAESPLFIQVGL
jgi:twitching motility protein PilI